jgi:TolA-binding protein
LRSINIYERIYNEYPNLDRRPIALFLEGFVFENEVGNVAAAKAKYMEFLKLYPTHRFARHVQSALDVIDKSPDQLLQEILARNKADSTAKAAIK